MSDNVEYSSLPVAPGLPASISAFVQEIRAYMRDYPELNRLTKGEENSDRMILWAVIDAIDDFNATPPPISVSIDRIPRSILRLGVVSTLLESVILLSTRNHLAYSDGGININLDRSGILMQMRQLLGASYEEKKTRWKISANIQAGYDSIPSEYFLMTGYYGAW